MESVLTHPMLPDFSLPAWLCRPAAKPTLAKAPPGCGLCDLWTNSGRHLAAETIAGDRRFTEANISAHEVFDRLVDVVAPHDPIGLYGRNEVTVPVEIIEAAGLPALRIYLWDACGTHGIKNHVLLVFRPRDVKIQMTAA